MDIQTFYGKYGVATTVTFTLRSPSATDSDTFYYATGDAGDALAQGDCFIFKDGAYDSTADNAPAEVTSTGNEVSIYTLQLSATEMSAGFVDVIVADQSATAFRDAHIRVFTEINLGNVDIDASQNTNTSALKLTGIGTGHGLEAIGGATGNDIEGVLGNHVLDSGTTAAGTGTSVTLPATASASNDYYNGAIILLHSGTGAGQARVITDYVGSTKVGTLNKAWVTAPGAAGEYVIIPGTDPWAVSPGAELSAMPTKTSAYADLLQFLFQRFAYKRTQTATAFNMYNEAGDTAVFDATLSDDATTQTHGVMDDV